MLRCAHWLLLGTGIFLSSGCEKEIDLSTLPKDIEEGEPSRFIKFVNSFRGEVEVSIAACFQKFRLLSDQIQSVECLIEEDINAFDVVVVWLNPPVGQGYAPPPPKTVTVSYGQVVEIKNVPGGTGSGFIILIDGRRQN